MHGPELLTADGPRRYSGSRNKQSVINKWLDIYRIGAQSSHESLNFTCGFRNYSPVKVLESKSVLFGRMMSSNLDEQSREPLSNNDSTS